MSRPDPAPDERAPTRVLIADDDATTRRVLQIRLQRLGYATSLAEDGEQALAVARASRPDVALVDWRMPKLDGLALTRCMRADADLGDVPVILLTADTEPENVAAGLAAGVDEYLHKPVHQTELQARVEHVLRRAGQVARLSEAARHDALTGLPNRTGWNERVGQELARSRRSGDPVCIALIDLDSFKAVNDTLGHDAGDALLAAAARSWRGALREADVLARLGGDEFAVLMPDTDLDGAERAIARLREATPDGRTGSAGIARWDGQEEPAALARRADQALYRAKREGRDRVVADRPAGGHGEADHELHGLGDIDEATRRVLVEQFVGATATRLREAAQAHRDGNGTALRRLAHRVKGSAGLLGATRIGFLAAELEHAAEPDVGGLLEELARAVAAMRASAAAVISPAPGSLTPSTSR